MLAAMQDGPKAPTFSGRMESSGDGVLPRDLNLGGVWGAMREAPRTILSRASSKRAFGPREMSITTLGLDSRRNSEVT